jgi:predicted Zn-dependent protease
VSGRPEVSLISERKERELGEAEAKKVAEAMGFLDDALLQAYVSTVGGRLAGFSPLRVRYTFHVVDMEEPNAFSLPGGYVYVTRGLLALMNTEDELAGVLGHEIGHVAARHSVRRVTRAAPLAVLTGVGAAVTGIVSPTLGNVVSGVGGFANDLVLAPYSRGQEREADEIGQKLAAQAGWDPSGISRSLRTLEREEALHAKTPRAMSFFATHPPLPERVAETEERARDLARATGAPAAATPSTFLHRLDGLPVGPRAADGVFDGETFLHPGLGFHFRFPPGWETANQRAIVGAKAPDGRAVVVLELVGKGNDPMAGLGVLAKETRADLASAAERLTIGGLAAVHVAVRGRTSEGPVAVELTWIAHAERIYRITGETVPEAADSTRPIFREAAGSFGPITGDERARVRESHLHLVLARKDETLGDLIARTEGTWSVEMAAVANGVDATTPLRRGQLVKVPRLVPYAPR